jgi:hypothetical protein
MSCASTRQPVMITFRDPPPLHVRVQESKKPAEVPGVFDAPIAWWLFGLFTIACLAVLAARQTTQRVADDAFAGAMTNSLPHQLEHEVLALVAPGTPMRDVRAKLDKMHLTCRTTDGADSSVTCLSPPVVFSNTYSRLSVHFAARDRKLIAVYACPTFVHWSSKAVQPALAQRVAASQPGRCWRDEANPADNEWTFATLPDFAFTVGVVHAADTVRRKAAATRDTLIVRW